MGGAEFHLIGGGVRSADFQFDPNSLVGRSVLEHEVGLRLIAQHAALGRRYHSDFPRGDPASGRTSHPPLLQGFRDVEFHGRVTIKPIRWILRTGLALSGKDRAAVFSEGNSWACVKHAGSPMGVDAFP